MYIKVIISKVYYCSAVGSWRKSPIQQLSMLGSLVKWSPLHPHAVTMPKTADSMFP